MAQEKEIKIQLKIPLADFLVRMQAKGFKLLKTTKQTDIYFDSVDWILYENLAALRLRLTDDKDGSFSFKKMFYLPNKLDQYYIEEIEIKAPFEDVTELKIIFDRLGIMYNSNIFRTGTELTEFLRNNHYQSEQTMHKIRKTFSDGVNEIVIDDIEKVGVIVELECPVEEPLNKVKELLNNEEWDRSIEGTGFVWLRKVKGKTSHLVNLERFKTDPTWNVWSNETEMYEKIAN